MSKKTLYLVLGVLTFGLLYNSFFIVSEKERAIVFQFGEAVRPDIPVGFHFLPRSRTLPELRRANGF